MHASVMNISVSHCSHDAHSYVVVKKIVRYHHDVRRDVPMVVGSGQYTNSQ